MPTVLVYEFVTARRLGEQPDSPLHSLFVEGLAMLRAARADFAAVPGVTVVPFPADVPDKEHQARFRQLAKGADWTFLIAPETGGELEHLAREVLKVGGKLLGPSPDAIALTTDKLELSRYWAKHRVPQIPTAPADDRPTEYPAVLKPRDGAGSEDMQRVNSVAEYEEAVRLNLGTGARIVQPLAAGLACSVAFLIGPKSQPVVPLLPTAQLLSTDGRFKYIGGELPLPEPLAERAIRLASKAVGCVRGLFGYVGVDLILGDAEDGSADVAVEINPRLTTSYVGLRAAAASNLAGLLLAIAAGNPVETPVWKCGPLSWTSAGQVLPA